MFSVFLFFVFILHIIDLSCLTVISLCQGEMQRQMYLFDSGIFFFQVQTSLLSIDVRTMCTNKRPSPPSRCSCSRMNAHLRCTPPNPKLTPPLQGQTDEDAAHGLLSSAPASHTSFISTLHRCAEGPCFIFFISSIKVGFQTLFSAGYRLPTGK